MTVRKAVWFLVVSIVIVVGSFSATLFATDHRPVLGLDLQGGISVVLAPIGNPKPDAIDKAVDIIRSRVDSLGVAEPEISRQGSLIIVDLPGVRDREKAQRLVGKTAELRFRQVLAESSALAGIGGGEATPAGGVSADLNARFAALDCTNPANLQGTGADSPSDTIVACARTGTTKYILGPAEVLGQQVSKATAGIDQQGAKESGE